MPTSWHRPESFQLFCDVSVLLVLYTLQGVPLGLADAFPYIIQTRGASYKDLARFSITTWPFSLKLLWAPLVDSFYIKRFGRRKTWIVLTQLMLGSSLIYLSRNVNHFLENIRSSASLHQLTCLFTITTFLAATQDIAVDGWGLSLMPRSHISYASLCNTVGQTAGYIIGNFLFLLLTSSFGTSSETKNQTLLSESTFIYYLGASFIALTLMVLVFKRERQNDDIPNDTGSNIWVAYRELLNYMSLPHVIRLSALILTSKCFFAATDSLISPKLIEFGFKKEDLVVLAVPSVIIQIIVSVYVGKIVKDRNSLTMNLRIFPLKLILLPVSMGYIHFIKLNHQDRRGCMILVVLFSVVYSIIGTFQFATIMNFFALITDPRFAGSQLTFLNTLSNLSFKWPHSLVLYYVENLTITSCRFDKQVNSTHCDVVVDGYHVVCLIGFVAGLFWYWKFKNTFIRLGHEAIGKVDTILRNKNT